MNTVKQFVLTRLWALGLPSAGCIAIFQFVHHWSAFWCIGIFLGIFVGTSHFLPFLSVWEKRLILVFYGVAAISAFMMGVIAFKSEVFS